MTGLFFFFKIKSSVWFHLQIPMPLPCQALTERGSKSIKISHIFLFLQYFWLNQAQNTTAFLTTGLLRFILPGWLFKRCDCHIQPCSAYFLCQSSFPEIAVIFLGACMLRAGQCFISLPEPHTRQQFYCSDGQKVSSHFFLCSHTLHIP